MADNRGNKKSRSTGRRSSILKRQDTCLLSEEYTEGMPEGNRTPKSKRVSFASTATVRTIEPVHNMMNSSLSDDNMSHLNNTSTRADDTQDDVFVPDVSCKQATEIGHNSQMIFESSHSNYADVPNVEQHMLNVQDDIFQQDKTVYFSNLEDSENGLELTANISQLPYSWGEQEKENSNNAHQFRLDRIPSFSEQQAADGEDNSIFFNLPPAFSYSAGDNATNKTLIFNPFNKDDGMDFTCHVRGENMRADDDNLPVDGTQDNQSDMDITGVYPLHPIEATVNTSSVVRVSEYSNQIIPNQSAHMQMTQNGNNCHFNGFENVANQAEDTSEDMEMTGEHNHFRYALGDITTHKALTPIEEMSLASTNVSQGDRDQFGKSQKLNFSQLRSRLVESISSTSHQHDKENLLLMTSESIIPPIPENGPSQERDVIKVGDGVLSKDAGGMKVISSSSSVNIDLSGNNFQEKIPNYDLSGSTKIFSGVSMELTQCVGRPVALDVNISKQFQNDEKTKLFSGTSMDLTESIIDQGYQAYDMHKRADSSFNPNFSGFTDNEKTKCFSGMTMDITQDCGLSDIQMLKPSCAHQGNFGNVSMNISSERLEDGGKTKVFDNERTKFFSGMTMDITQDCGSSDIEILKAPKMQQGNGENITRNPFPERLENDGKAKVSDLSMNVTLCGQVLKGENVDETQQVSEKVDGFVSEKTLNFKNEEMEVVSFTSYCSPNVNNCGTINKRISRSGNQKKLFRKNETNTTSNVSLLGYPSQDIEKFFASSDRLIEDDLSKSYKEVDIRQENPAQNQKVQSKTIMKYTDEKVYESFVNQSVGNTDVPSQTFQSSEEESRVKHVKEPSPYQKSSLSNNRLPSQENNTLRTLTSVSTNSLSTFTSSKSSPKSDREHKRLLLRQSLQKELFYTQPRSRKSFVPGSSLLHGVGGKNAIELHTGNRNSIIISKSLRGDANFPENNCSSERLSNLSNVQVVSEKDDLNETPNIDQSVFVNPVSPASSQIVEAEISRVMEGSHVYMTDNHQSCQVSVQPQRLESSAQKNGSGPNLLSPEADEDVLAASDSLCLETKTQSGDVSEDSCLLMDQMDPNLLDDVVMPALESFDDGKEAALLSYLEQSYAVQEKQSKNMNNKDLTVSDIHELLGLNDMEPFVSQKSAIDQHGDSCSLEGQLEIRLFMAPQLTCLQNYTDDLERKIKKMKSSVSSSLQRLCESPSPDLLSLATNQMTDKDISDMKSNVHVFAKAQLNKLQADYLLNLTSAHQREDSLLKSDPSAIILDNERAHELQSTLDRSKEDLEIVIQRHSELEDLKREGQGTKDKISCLRSHSQHLDGAVEQSRKRTLECQERRDTLEDDLSLVQERLGWMTCLCEWTLLRNSQNELRFGFLHNTVIVNVIYVNCEDPHRQMTHIAARSRISHDNRPWAHIANKVMMRNLDANALKLKYGGFNQVSLLLNDISKLARISRDLFEELKKADLVYQVNFNECRMKAKITSPKSLCEVEIETDLAEGMYPHQPLNWSILKVLGSIPEEQIHLSLDNAMTGEGYLMRALEAVSSNLDK